MRALVSTHENFLCNGVTVRVCEREREIKIERVRDREEKEERERKKERERKEFQHITCRMAGSGL